jgi:PTH1 family peptidyl-tRNA hydrolase
VNSLSLTRDKTNIKLIVGLGNIGEKYSHTRHNAGFLFVDYLTHFFLKSKGFHSDKQEDKYYKVYTFEELDIVCLKPSMMMNRSGEALLEFIKYKDYMLSEILVVHDDLDIALGKYKLQPLKSPKLHNGITSIEKVLAGKDFYRLRIGVENRKGLPISGVSFVLEKFSKEELDQLDLVFNDILCDEFIINSID